MTKEEITKEIIDAVNRDDRDAMLEHANEYIAMLPEEYLGYFYKSIAFIGLGDGKSGLENLKIYIEKNGEENEDYYGAMIGLQY